MNVDNSLSPHGGVLVERVQPRPDRDALARLPTIAVREQIAHECVNLAYGFFSPLTGFMGSADVAAVSETMRLTSSYVWPIPIVLDVAEAELRQAGVAVGNTVLLTHQGNPLATLDVSEIFAADLTDLARQVYATTDPGPSWRAAHPELRRPFRRRRRHAWSASRSSTRPSTATGARRRSCVQSWRKSAGSAPSPTRPATCPTPATST